MKLQHIILVILLALGAGYLGSHIAPQSITTEPKKETAYERVIRTGTLRCGYELWPDSTDKDPNTGAMSGWVPAVTEELGKKLGLKIEWTAEFQFGQQATLLESGKVDALCTSDGPWTYTDAKYVDWTHPIVYYPIYLMVRGDETRFHSYEDFNKPDVVFTAMDGDISASLYKDWFPNAKRLDVPQGGDPSLLALNIDGKKADAVFLDEQMVQRIKKSANINIHRFSDKPFMVVPASFSVAKNQPALLQVLNQGFDMLQDMGIVEKIFKDRKLDTVSFLPDQHWQNWEHQ